MDKDDIQINDYVGTWKVLEFYHGDKVKCECKCGYPKTIPIKDLETTECPIYHDNRYYETNGQCLTLMEWARVIKVPYPVLYGRIHIRGLLIHEALVKPLTQDEINGLASRIAHEHSDDSIYTKADKLRGAMTSSVSVADKH